MCVRACVYVFCKLKANENMFTLCAVYFLLIGGSKKENKQKQKQVVTPVQRLQLQLGVCQCNLKLS